MPPPSDTEPCGSTGRKRSFVWNIFYKYPNNKIRCKICKKEFTHKKNDGTGSLKRHIEHVHPSHFADLTTQAQLSVSASGSRNPIAPFNYESELLRREIVRWVSIGMPSSSSSNQGGFGYMMNIYNRTGQSSSSTRKTLSEIARDILIALFSTVTSKSVFPNGRHTIDKSRSQMSNNTLEALMCLADWYVFKKTRLSGSISMSRT
ncbi:hypothetical protein M9H77_23260 [Catharanthus roseus]|uniref:Uncharacterized protein n=1 Tax=Catharanthus roseus TaxID=4058 RepID=A0ACC0AU13_CATRO|nr:hypothetical protein M9H77_23260 [Catharanthus roseus]